MIRQLISESPYVMNAVGSDDPNVRERFVNRVFIILSLQMAYTAVLVTTCHFVDPVMEIMAENRVVALMAWIGFLVVFLAILLGGKRMRLGRLGVVCLVLLTACLAHAAAHTSLEYLIQNVLFAVSIAAIILFTIALFTTYTKFDFTKRSRYVAVCFLIATVGMLLWPLLNFLMPADRSVEVFGAIFGSTMFVMCLLFQLQAIAGGRATSVRPDEVIYAAAQLYACIVLVYCFLLKFRF